MGTGRAILLPLGLRDRSRNPLMPGLWHHLPVRLVPARVPGLFYGPSMDCAGSGFTVGHRDRN